MQKIVTVFIAAAITLAHQALCQSYVYRITADKKVLTGFKAMGIKGIITALHGVAGFNNITVQKFENAESLSNTIFQDGVNIVKIDIPNDICIISSPSINAIPLNEGYAINTTYTRDDLKGQNVMINGFPLGMVAKQNINLQFDNDNPIVELQSYLPSSLAPGLLRRNSPKTDITIFDLHGSIVPGHSGAPILFKNQVIGMADGGLNGGTMGFGWAIILKNVHWAAFSNSAAYQALSAKSNELFSYQFAFPDSAKVSDYVNIPTVKFDIAILITGEQNKFVTTVSSGIADIYRNKGNSVTTSLFRTAFLNSVYLDELQTANTQIIDQLELPSSVKYIIIGKYSSKIDNGSYTKYISRATLDISIISCMSKSVTGGFTLQAANGFDDASHAEQGVIEKLLKDFRLNHSNL